MRKIPLTATGAVVLAVGLAFLARGMWLDDLYQLTLGFLAIAAPLAAAVAAWIQGGRFAGVEVRWEASADTMGTMVDPHRWGQLRALISPAAVRRPWFFFRLHASARGFVQVGESERFHFFETRTAVEPEELRLPLALPLPGIAALRTEVQVRDTFGLSRMPLSRRTEQAIAVPPALPRAPQLIRSPATSGEEESPRTRSPEEERYYMREYIAGDRFRDINWKASTRIRELYTRISPQTQEESKTLTVYLRHFCSAERRSIEALVHVAYIKGWLLAMMQTLKHEDERLAFRVVTARGTRLCTTPAEIAQFGYEMADLWAIEEPSAQQTGATDVVRGEDPPDGNRRSLPVVPSGALVFTTPFDHGLNAFVTQQPRTAMMIFATQPAGVRGNAELHSDDAPTVLFGGHLLPVRPLRLRAPQKQAAVWAPAGARLVEEVALTMHWEPEQRQ